MAKRLEAAARMKEMMMRHIQRDFAEESWRTRLEAFVEQLDNRFHTGRTR